MQLPPFRKHYGSFFKRINVNSVIHRLYIRLIPIRFGHYLYKGGGKMGKDRQEKKLKESKRVESDRDQSLKYKGATSMEGPEEARKRNS